MRRLLWFSNLNLTDDTAQVVACYCHKQITKIERFAAPSTKFQTDGQVEI